ncbi:MAG: hypothetical protein H7330_11145 [Hymenobacteraceae bacterium]|nr:hypothetical protein [Hymenobacteraceae bacterium]
MLNISLLVARTGFRVPRRRYGWRGRAVEHSSGGPHQQTTNPPVSAN